MRELASLGTHALLVVSGGGKELGGRREEIEREMNRALPRAGRAGRRAQLHRAPSTNEPVRLFLPQPRAPAAPAGRADELHHPERHVGLQLPGGVRVTGVARWSLTATGGRDEADIIECLAATSAPG